MGCTAGKDMAIESNGHANQDSPTHQHSDDAERKSQTVEQRHVQTPTGETPRGNISSFAKGALREHNAYREVHHAPPLVLNATLCDMADRLCRHLAAARTFANSTPEDRLFNGEECGESLFRHWGGKDGKVTAQAVCKSWYDEVNNYHSDMAGFDLATCECSHFTQMVWKKTREMGIAQAHYDDDDGFRKFIVVANYFPSGNIDGTYELNVVIPEGFFDHEPQEGDPENTV